MKVRLQSQTQAQIEAIAPARSGSYIWHGPHAVGKATAAHELAQRLNCQGHHPDVCAACRQFEAGSYPDLTVVRPESKPSIVIEQIRTLVQALSLSLYHSQGTRVVIIDDAHLMTPEAQNALLKLIEEPPPQTLFILIAERLESLLVTVRSRCSSIYFPKLTSEQITQLLIDTHGIKSSEAVTLSAIADGAAGVAVSLASNATAAEERRRLQSAAVNVLTQSLFERLLLAGQLVAEKTDLNRFGSMLHNEIISQIQAGTEIKQASYQLNALEQFRRALSAKVSPRVAIDRLMLELS